MGFTHDYYNAEGRKYFRKQYGNVVSYKSVLTKPLGYELITVIMYLCLVFFK